MKRCIVNLSTLKYDKGQMRLRSTLIGNTDADLRFYNEESDVGAPLHRNNKYAFKPYAIDKSRREGYDVVLWLDASMYVRRPLGTLFEKIEKHGYFWQDSGWMNDRWTTPEQETYFGTNKGRMISSGVIGLDFRTKVANDFLNHWLQAAKAGMFNGSHDVTRHDQTAASLIIEKMGLGIVENNEFWSYGNPSESFEDNILIIANGIV